MAALDLQPLVELSLSNCSFGDDTTIIGNLTTNIISQELLPTAEGATFDSLAEQQNAECHPGTRIEVLQQIQEWIDDPTRECIFWLEGMAGTGKSTISRTIAKHFEEQKTLGASFFFKRRDGNRGLARLFFTTIASGLISHKFISDEYVRGAIKDDPVLKDKSLAKQFEKLIFRPLQNIRREPSDPLKIVIVVDALDECDGEDNIDLIIQLLSRVKDLSSVCMRIFITSRPDRPIRLGFSRIKGEYQHIALHEIPATTIERDISAFLKFELPRIKQDYDHTQLAPDWPSESTIQTLVGMAIPLFISASTICRFIRSNSSSPDKQLAKYLKCKNTSGLGATYLPVLDQLLKGVDDCEMEDVVEEFRKIVGSIIVLESPLSARSLAGLLGIPRDDIDDRLLMLHSVLSIPPSADSPIRPLHLSFHDFLVDPKNKTKTRLWVDGIECHKRLANRCLQVLIESLKEKNICSLGTPGMNIKEIDAKIIDEALPAHLRYACEYWFRHLKRSGCRLRDRDEVHLFLHDRFLYWLEALSLMGKVSESITMMDILQTLLEPGLSSDLSALLYDVRRFVMNFRSVIANSPLQTYASALLFSPSQSITRDLFRKDEPKWVITKPAMEHTWAENSQTLEGHNSWVGSLAFSPDGRYLASASYDGTVKIWYADTGECSQTLKDQSCPAISVAFLDGGHYVASAAHDGTIKIWHTVTGTIKKTLKVSRLYVSRVIPSTGPLGYGSGIDVIKLSQKITRYEDRIYDPTFEYKGIARSVAFSPDGQYIAVPSLVENLFYLRMKNPYNIEIWNIKGDHCQTLQGHAKQIGMIIFSPDNRYVASASLGPSLGDTVCPIIIWDRVRERRLFTLQNSDGCRSAVHSVAFSPNNQYIASASEDHTIKIWNSRTGNYCQTLYGHIGPVYSVAFSPDSQYITSASGDRTVKVWHASTGDCVQKFEGHSDSVVCVAFSPDGRYVVSSSNNGIIRISHNVGIRHVGTSHCRQTLKGHVGPVHLVAFSPNTKYLASVSDDYTIKIWHADVAHCYKTLEVPGYLVYSIVFSPDGRFLLSASHDGTVQIWHTHTGYCCMTLKGLWYALGQVAFSHNGRYLASTSDDGTIKIWNTSTGCYHQTRQGIYNSIDFSHDNKYVASASDNYLSLWHAKTGLLHWNCSVDNGAYYAGCIVAFSPCSQYIMRWSGVSIESIGIRDTNRGITRRRFIIRQFYRQSSLFTPSSDGQYIAIAYDSTVELWATEDNCRQATLKSDVGPVHSVIFLPNDLYIAVLYSRTAKIWDINTGECRQTLLGYAGPIHFITFSPNNQDIVLASSSQDGTIKIWDTNIGNYCQTPKKTLKDHDDQVVSVIFSPNSEHVSSMSRDGIIKIWDSSTGDCRQSIRNDPPSTRFAFAFSPNSRYIVFTSNRYHGITIWDVSTGLCQLRVDIASNATYSFSPDGRYIASISRNLVNIWDISAGSCLRTLSVNITATDQCLQIPSTNIIRDGIFFSPDSQCIAIMSHTLRLKVENSISIFHINTDRHIVTDSFQAELSSVVGFGTQYIASVSERGTIEIWDADTGKYCHTFKWDAPDIYLASFSPDGQYVAVASKNGTIRIWHISTSKCCQTLYIGRVLYTRTLSFDSTSSYIYTEVGTICLDLPSTFNARRIIAEPTDPQKPQYQGYSISSDHTWITFNSQNLLRLPQEYRPSQSEAVAVSAATSTVAIGCASGRVLILRLLADGGRGCR